MLLRRRPKRAIATFLPLVVLLSSICLLSATAAEQGTPRRTSSIASVRGGAEERIRYAFDLGARNAAYSARAEFLKALELIALALDEDEGGTEHSQALENGMRAMREAEDFVPGDANLDVRWNLTHLIASHRTPVLKHADTRRISLTAALQAYYAYATEMLANGGGHEPLASVALYGWSRVEATLTRGSSQSDPLSGARSIALHHAALLVDEQNYLAANELGVLLARYGQMEEAKSVLEHSLAVSPQPETCQNLAKVHHVLGDKDAAKEALAQARALEKAAGSSAAKMVRWVEAPTFVQDSGPDQFADMATGSTQSSEKRLAAKPSSAWTSWLKPKALGDILAGPSRRTETVKNQKP